MIILDQVVRYLDCPGLLRLGYAYPSTDLGCPTLPWLNKIANTLLASCRTIRSKLSSQLNNLN